MKSKYQEQTWYFPQRQKKEMLNDRFELHKLVVSHISEENRVISFYYDFISTSPHVLLTITEGMTIDDTAPFPSPVNIDRGFLISFQIFFPLFLCIYRVTTICTDCIIKYWAGFSYSLIYHLFPFNEGKVTYVASCSLVPTGLYYCPATPLVKKAQCKFGLMTLQTDDLGEKMNL